MHALQSCQPPSPPQKKHAVKIHFLPSANSNFCFFLCRQATEQIRRMRRHASHAVSIVTTASLSATLSVRDPLPCLLAVIFSRKRQLFIRPSEIHLHRFSPHLRPHEGVSVLKRQATILTKCTRLFHKLDVNVCFHKCHILTSAKTVYAEKKHCCPQSGP